MLRPATVTATLRARPILGVDPSLVLEADAAPSQDDALMPTAQTPPTSIGRWDSLGHARPTELAFTSFPEPERAMPNVGNPSDALSNQQSPSPDGGAPSGINYSAERLRSEYEMRRPIRDVLARIVDHYAIQGWKVVELGSGLGFNLEIFSPRNEVLGIEGLQSAARIAQDRGVHTIVADLAYSLPLETSSCDLVLCLDVLEHLMEPEVTLKEARRILRPDGRLVVNVPNHFTLSGRLRMLFGSGIDSMQFFPDCSDWNNPHVRFFRKVSIAALLENSGYKIVDDWSAQFASIPLFHRFGWHRSRLAVGLARRSPDLFAGGFFLVCTVGGSNSHVLSS